MQETWIWSLGREDPLEKKMTTHSSILAWENSTNRGVWQAIVCSPWVTKESDMTAIKRQQPGTGTLMSASVHHSPESLSQNSLGQWLWTHPSTGHCQTSQADGIPRHRARLGFSGQLTYADIVHTLITGAHHTGKVMGHLAMNPSSHHPQVQACRVSGGPGLLVPAPWTVTRMPPPQSIAFSIPSHWCLTGTFSLFSGCLFPEALSDGRTQADLCTSFKIKFTKIILHIYQNVPT